MFGFAPEKIQDSASQFRDTEAALCRNVVLLQEVGAQLLNSTAFDDFWAQLRTVSRDIEEECRRLQELRAVLCDVQEQYAAVEMNLCVQMQGLMSMNIQAYMPEE